MARQALPLIGAVIGGIYGGPAGAQAGMAIGSLIGNAVDPQIIKGPDLGDGQVTTSQEGVARPIVWGTGCVGANIIARGELKKRIHKEKQGKGGPVVTEERFYLTYAIRICQGPVDGILRIWEDEKLVYDNRAEDSQMTIEDNEKYAEQFRLYLGGEDQLPDSELESIFGVGDTPAYRGTAYIVFPNRDVTDRRGSVPNYRFEVSTAATFTQYPDLIRESNQSYYIDRSQQKVIYRGPHNLNLVNTYKPYPFFSHDGMFILTNQSNGYGSYVKYFNRETGQYDIDFGKVNSNNYNAFFHNKTNLLICLENFTANTIDFKVYKPNMSTNTFDLMTTQTFTYGSPGAQSAFGNAYFNDNGTRFIVRHNSNGFMYSFDAYTGTISNVNGAPFAQGVSKNKGTILLSSVILWSSYGNQFRSYRMDPITNSMVQNGVLSISGQGSEAGSIFWAKSRSYIYRVNGSTDENAYIQGYSWMSSPSNSSNYDIFPVTLDIEQPVNHYIKLSGEITVDSTGEFVVMPAISIANPTDTRPIIVFRCVMEDNVDKLKLFFEGIPEDEAATSGAGGVNSLIVSSINGTSAMTGVYDVPKIIEDIANTLKIDPTKIDLTDIEDLKCRGLVAAEQYSGGNIIRKLQESSFFDPSEYDDKIHFVKRGKPVVKSISYDQTVLGSYEFRRNSTIEYPYKVEMLYQNPKVGYAVAKAVARRSSPDNYISGHQTTTVPVTLFEDEAAKIVDIMHKVSWAEAEGEYTFSLPTEFDYLTTSDCIGFFTDKDLNLNQNSIAYRLRIEKMETADGVINLTCHVDRQTAYVSQATGIPVPTPTAPPTTIVGQTQFVYLDIPALIDSNDLLGYYNTGTGISPVWSGAQHQRADVTNEFYNQNTISQGLLVGEIIQDLAASSEHYSDTTNSIVVRIYHNYDQPQAVTQDQLLQEQNACAIQRADGSAEILQFRDVEDLGNNTYRLSYLLRGRLNSGVSLHEDGARWVLLDDTYFVQVNSSLLGKDLMHRAVSYGQTTEEANVYTYTFTGRSQIEFPVDQLNVEIVGSDAQVSWSPRERFGTDVNPIRSQNWQNYHVKYTDGTLTEEFDVLLPEHTHDVSAYSGTLTVTVTQVNRITGQGPAVSESVAV